MAELQRLRELAARPESWLGWLVGRIQALHEPQGVARRTSSATPGLIAVGSAAAFGDELRTCVLEAKREIQALRETSAEW